MLGKAAFYFGFIFFSLDVVGFTLRPLAQSPLFMAILSRSRTPLSGVLAGMVVTAIIQSSSITTGLCILLVQQTILPATANTLGVVLFLPFLGWFAATVVDFAVEPGMAVAWAQLIFNLVMTLIVLIVLRVFHSRAEQFFSLHSDASELPN